MNRFRKLGFIEYNDRIKVHKSLLNAVLLDQIPKRSPRGLLLRPLHEFDRSPSCTSSMGRLSKLELSVVCTERIRTHARAGRAAGFTAFGAPKALKPLRTDSANRGLFISSFTRERILLSISVWPFFFMKRPFFER